MLKGRADDKILCHIKELINQESDIKKRGDLYSATVTIASRYREKDFLWKFFKEELKIIQESAVVQDCIDEGVVKGKREGKLEGKRDGMEKAVIDVLEVRFETAAKETIADLKKIESVDILESLLKNAIKAGSLSEFNENLR